MLDTEEKQLATTAFTEIKKTTPSRSFLLPQNNSCTVSVKISEMGICLFVLQLFLPSYAQNAFCLGDDLRTHGQPP